MTSIGSVLALLIVSIVFISSAYANDPPGNFTLPKTSPNLCFIARFNLTMNVEYLKSDGKKNTTRIPLNNETFYSYDGACILSDKTHTLTINMLDGLTSVTFTFTKDAKNQTALSKVTVSLTINNVLPYFTNYSKSVEGLHLFAANESLFSTSQTNSYRCNSKTKIENFKEKGDVTLKSIEFENLRVQPFVDVSVVFNDYAAEKVCTMDYFHNTNLIPIIVGIVLAVLVVVVLISYLVYRRRARNGYQSV